MGKNTKKESTTESKKVVAKKKPAVKKKTVTKKKTVKENSVVAQPVLQKIEMPASPTRENGIVVLITGGFDPLHSGHLDYIDSAKDLGREGSWHGAKVVVGVNSDDWLVRKKGKAFMPVEERVRLLLAMRNVDQVITFDDTDDSSMNAIHITRHMFPDEHIIFANGGDRNHNGELVMQKREVKIKELTVDPGKSLSMQRHTGRAEFWFVANGIASVYTVAYPNDAKRDVGDILVGKFGKHDSTWIPVQDWHMLVNNESEPLTICEIQYGDNCIEEDIERVFRNKK